MKGDPSEEQSTTDQCSEVPSTDDEAPFDPFRYQLRTIPPKLRAQLLHAEPPLLRPDELAERAPFAQRLWLTLTSARKSLGELLWARRIPVGIVLLGVLLVCLSVLVALAVSRGPSPPVRADHVDRYARPPANAAALPALLAPSIRNGELAQQAASSALSLPLGAGPASVAEAMQAAPSGQVRQVPPGSSVPGGGPSARRTKLWLPD